jgi:hypothetical protein
MKTPLRKLKKSDIMWAVDRNKKRIEVCARQALSFLADPNKKERQSEQYCVCCFYRENTIAGQACTESQCGVCEKQMQWSTTHQEKLCESCAKKLGLCKECSATIELKEPRKFKTEEISLADSI